MNKIQSIWHIKDGDIKIEKRDQFMAAVQSLPNGKYFVNMEKAYKKRSNQQNRALFGIPYKLIAEGLSSQWGKQISVAWVHEFCKDNKKNQLDLLPLEYEERIKEEWENDPNNKIINSETGEVITLPFVPTTTKMRTPDAMEYYANLQEFGRNWLGIEIADPDPQWKERAKQAEIEHLKSLE